MIIIDEDYDDGFHIVSTNRTLIPRSHSTLLLLLTYISRAIISCDSLCKLTIDCNIIFPIVLLSSTIGMSSPDQIMEQGPKNYHWIGLVFHNQTKERVPTRNLLTFFTVTFIMTTRLTIQKDGYNLTSFH